MLKFMWEISGVYQKMFLEVVGGREEVCVCAERFLSSVPLLLRGAPPSERCPTLHPLPLSLLLPQSC